MRYVKPPCLPEKEFQEWVEQEERFKETDKREICFECSLSHMRKMGMEGKCWYRVTKRKGYK